VQPGAQLAVLEGNPLASSGDYTVRLKTPDGYRIAPHWHPQRENVTVLSGTFETGHGGSF
jgi:anti-sigma factor ChrR (cupin superfamily)